MSIKGLQSRFALEDVKELVGVVHAGCIRGELSLPPSRPSPLRGWGAPLKQRGSWETHGVLKRLDGFAGSWVGP